MAKTVYIPFKCSEGLASMLDRCRDTYVETHGERPSRSELIREFIRQGVNERKRRLDIVELGR